MPLYFAYGSNLKLERLRSRVGEVGTMGIAVLENHRLSFAKRGSDGSGKACVEPAPGERVWGAVYQLSAAQHGDLDAFEPGYSHTLVRLECPDGTALEAITYHAEHFTDDPVPYDWYKQLLVDGAREHQMPVAWQAHLQGVPSKPDLRES